MKKLLSISASKIYLVCGLGLVMTLGAFWHHQINQTQLDRLNILNQGVGTCFNRVSQTFTAMMIKDLRSPYLNREFMGLSNECLSETVKGINPFKKNVGKGFETLNQLISEVHWFHEKISKSVGSADIALAPISDRFSKMENFKINLVDEIDLANSQLRSIMMNDEYLMGAGLIIFILSLSILSLQEFNRLQLQREIEREALSFLKSGKNNVGALVDTLVDRALITNGMNVTAQVFRDYHGDILERLSVRPVPVAETKPEAAPEPQIIEEAPAINAHKTSLKEVLVSIQNLQPKETIQMTEVRDVQLNVHLESFEQMMNAAINQLASRRTDNKKVMISNQIHSDKSVINLFLAGGIFNSSELEFSYGQNAVAADSIDMNLVILKEMVAESGAHWHLENKADRNGNITGMNIRFIVNRTPKEKSKLVSLMKGKKKDLRTELMN